MCAIVWGQWTGGVDVKDDPCVGRCFRERSCDTVYDNANADVTVRNPAHACLDVQDTTESPNHPPLQVSPVGSDRSAPLVDVTTSFLPYYFLRLRIANLPLDRDSYSHWPTHLPQWKVEITQSPESAGNGNLHFRLHVEPGFTGLYKFHGIRHPRRRSLS